MASLEREAGLAAGKAEASQAATVARLTAENERLKGANAQLQVPPLHPIQAIASFHATVQDQILELVKPSEPDAPLPT